MKDEGNLTERRRALDVAIVIFMAILTVGFFWRAFFEGKVILAGDALSLLSPWKFFANGALGNITLSDPVREFFPWKLFLIESLKSGIVPLWNPYVLAGTPFISNIQAAHFYPLNIVFALFEAKYAYGYYIVAHFFVGSGFMYWYGRVLALNRAASLGMAVVFMFSMYVTNWAQQIPVLSVVVWLPLMLLLVEKMFDKRSVHYAVLLGLASAVQIFGGNIQFSFYLFLVVGVYFLFRLGVFVWQTREGAASAIMGSYMGLALLIGAGVAAVQLIPTFEILDSIVRRGDSYEIIMSGAYKLEWLRTFLVPHYFNNPGQNFMWADFPLYSGYVGVLPLILGMIGVFFRRDRYGIFFGVLAAVGALLALGTPLYKALYYLPLGSTLRNPSRIIFVYVFSMAVLSGLGLDYLSTVYGRLREEPGLRSTSRRRLLYFLISLVALAVFLVPDAINQLLTERAPVRYVMREVSLFMILLTVSSSVIALYLLRALPLRVFKTALVGIIIFDLFLFNMSFISYMKPERVYFETPSIKFLKEDKSLFRIVRFGREPLYSPLTPNTGMVYGLHDIQGSDVFILRRYIDFLNLVENRRDAGFYNEITNMTRRKSLESPLLDLLNVKYVLASGEIPGWSERKVFGRSNKDMFIYRNPDHLPRVFLVPETRVVETPKEALRALKDPAFDPRRQVILEEGSGDEEPVELNGHAAAPSGLPGQEAIITQYSGDQMEVSTASDRPQMLVVSDGYYPGWTATLDGREVPVARANYVLKAVEVPAGEHRVMLKFAPSSYVLGKRISFATVALSGAVSAIAALVAARRRKVAGVKV